MLLLAILLGENFGTLARERLEAAAALTKTLGIEKPCLDFHKSLCKNYKGCRGGAHHSSHYSKGDGNPATAKLPRNSHQRNDN